MQVSVRLFAAHRDLVGAPALVLELPEQATAGLAWERLVGLHPVLAPWGGRVMIAVNQAYASASTALHDGDEVAFIPPVSGGATEPAATADHAPVEPYLITASPLDPLALMRYVQSPSDGAVVVFSGVARDNFGGRATARLEYQAYPELALPVLRQLEDEARARWRIGRMAVHHRIGVLAIGEAAVLVVVAAPHRQEAFAAAQYVMDRIKEVVPIWKREIWADGEAEWVADEQSRKSQGAGP